MKIGNLILGWLLGLMLVMACPAAANTPDEPTDFYLEKIKPLLKEKCYSCHGAINQEAGLRVDTASALRQGGDSGPAILSGAADTSLLLKRIASTDPDQRMPPESEPLTPDQIAWFSAWINNGAHAPADEPSPINPSTHWAFQPLQSTDPPGNPAIHPINAFVRQRLSAVGLQPNGPADPTTLVRRMYLDLHGLPPTPDEIRQFESAFAEHQELAVVRLVDRLLASPRYGERWAQHWLDLVRYADTHGFEVNTPRPNAWPYRDYVINALNADKPYDDFVFEQLAGDTVGQDAATGFLVAAAVLLPGQIGKDDASKRLARQDALDEMVIGTSATFLGLTVGCARCHDHKFDPITQADYYAMQAFFAGVEYGDRPISDPLQKQRKAESARLATRIAELTKQLRQQEPLATIPGTIILNEAAAAAPGSSTKLRDPVSPAGNIDRFSPIHAKFVRFTTTATNNDNQYEPCINELQVFSVSQPLQNIALAENGTIPTSSGNRAETGKHQLKHINDGKHGNSYSWISNEIGRGWVQLEFPTIQTINCVEWARDRLGQFKDRLPVEYEIAVSLDGSEWTPVASSQDQLPLGTSRGPVTSRDQNPSQHPESGELAAELKKLTRQKQELDQPRMVFAGKMRQPDATYVLLRGDPEQRKQPIGPQTPTVFRRRCEPGSEEHQRRIALANWIIDPENPLTARVIVNRVWQTHFGQGLVPTPSDFGLNGVPPSHPELLDWLANRFMDNGWSLKQLHRSILTSSTYQQSSQTRSAAQALDADNRLLWRFASRRLEAEAIRDSILYLGGQLNLKMGGPGFDFFKSRGGLSGFPPVEQFDNTQLRRMIYAHKIRMEQVPVFGAFDCPDAGQPAPSRSRSTTAIQALNLFNSPFVARQSDRFADHLKARAPDSVERQIELAFLKTLGRLPTQPERSAVLDAAHEHGLSMICRVLFNSNEFLFIP